MTPIFAFAFAALQMQVASPSSDERTELYRWFDTLPYAAMLKGSFGEVAAANSQHRGERYAVFMTGKKGQPFLKPDLTREFATSGDIYRQIDFRGWLDKYMTDILRHERVVIETDGRIVLPVDDVELFVLSYVAHVRGLEDASDKLYAEAVKNEHDTDGHNEEHDYTSFGDWLKDNLATIEFDRLEIELCRGRFSRKYLIPDFEAFVKCYPGTQAYPVAQKTLKTIRQMAADERSHKPLDFGSATLKQKIDEYMYQSISVENIGGQIPNYVDVWETFPPATVMAQMGYQAIPYLIDHLEDSRFTNAGERSLYGGTVGNIFRVRDVALDILHHITAGKIVGNNGSPLSDDEASYSILHARQWWAIASKQSESENIEAEIRSGSQAGVSLIPRLRLLAPSHVFSDVQEGLKRTSSPSACRELLFILLAKGTPEAMRIIESNLREGKELWRRQAAGEALLPTMPELVARTLSDKLTETIGPSSSVRDYDAEGLDSLLLRSGQGKAIRALSDHLSQYPTNRRVRLFMYLYMGPFERGKAAYNWSKSPQEIADFQNEVERLLALELNDVEPTDRSWFDSGIQNFSETRFCDWASLCLAQLFPEKYWFRPYRSIKKRDYVRMLNLRTWEAGLKNGDQRGG